MKTNIWKLMSATVVLAVIVAGLASCATPTPVTVVETVEDQGPCKP